MGVSTFLDAMGGAVSQPGAGAGGRLCWALATQGLQAPTASHRDRSLLLAPACSGLRSRADTEELRRGRGALTCEWPLSVC